MISRLSHVATVLALTFVSVLVTDSASADELILQPLADGMLYESASGDLANGAGEHLFAGVGNATKRAVLRFDLSGVPAGATIDAVEFTLNMSRTIAGNEDVAMHRLTTAWSEGATIALGQEGGGGSVVAGDVTWLHTTYDTNFWTTPGGDFAAAPSAVLGVGGLGAYTWGSTAGLVADVQTWVDAPASNFGWILIGNESAPTTAKRFDSRENTDPGVQPELRVVFSPVSPGNELNEVPTLDPRALMALALLLALVGALLLKRL